MRFPEPLTEGLLIRRYARFLADISLQDGTTVTAHTANTGKMLGCSDPGSRVWISRSYNPKRKHPFTWEIIETLDHVLVGVNTARSSALVEEAITNKTIFELQGYHEIDKEVRYGKENSRIDLLLKGHKTRPDCYVEVKNVTAVVDRMAIFPDAVSQRGTKHMRELQAMVSLGKRAMVCFCVQRGDTKAFRPADRIDPVYGETLCQAVRYGVEAIAYEACVDPIGIQLIRPLQVILS